MLDRVIDIAAWPLPAQHQEALLKRRIGLGWTGLADALLMLNLSYDTPQARAMAARMARVLRDTAIMASIDLALELGPFPAFRPDRLDPGVVSPESFMGRLPEPLRERARLLGLRNSHLLALAPTGSISIACADNVSPGIEPVWAWTIARPVRDRDARLHTLHLEDHAWRLYRHRFGPDARRPRHFKLAHQVSPQDHLAMVAEVAPFIDGGISKTVNVPETTSREAVQDLFLRAWRDGVKGLTVFRSRTSLQEGSACAA
jgi:ribonucleoside-diphosphate reductase alpha chain